MSAPPPPPPHGESPKTTAGGSGLPPGKYDIFIIPEHSAGSGFLYLPSLRPNINSFVAGFASALVLVVLGQSMAPAFQAWWANFQGMGNMGMMMLVIAVGLGAWSMGRAQQDDGGTRPGGSSGAHHSQAPPPPGAGFGGGHGNTGSHSQSAPPPNPPPPPPPPPQPEPQPEPPKPEKPKPSWQQRAPPQPDTSRADAARSAWEKAREETRRKDEERKKEEAEKKRKEEIEQKLRELREKEKRERAAREAKDKAERDAREKKAREEQEKKEQEMRERLEKLEQDRRERELREQRARELKEKLEREEKLAKERQEKERLERLAKEKAEREAKAQTEARKGSTYAFSAVGEKTNPWPNGKPPAATASPSSAARSAAPTPSTPPPPKKTPTPSAARSHTGTEEDAHSFRPYDKPKRPAHKKSVSDFSESSWAPSHSTAQTTPPPSMRVPYTTKDPDKIVIRAVYGFINQFAKTPSSQLISGIGSVTDGLILRITTEGMFIDDDVRGVPQREWDIKAWTLKLVETGEWKPKGVHILRATIRDQEGKRYLFLLNEDEAWKLAMGLQRLRKGAQARALGVAAMTAFDVKNTLEVLGWM